MFFSYMHKMSVTHLDTQNISTVELTSNSHPFERIYGEWATTVRLNAKPLLTTTRSAKCLLGLK